MRYTLRPNSRTQQIALARERIVAAELKRLELRSTVARAAPRRNGQPGFPALD
jgi:hypothetical protein